MDLIWTKEKPKQQGWYWWRLESGSWAGIVEFNPENELDRREAEWAGPIPKPRE